VGATVKRNTIVRTENEVNVVLKSVKCLEYKMDGTGKGEVLVGAIEQAEVTFHMMTAESKLVPPLDFRSQVIRAVGTSGALGT
jgi:hypothetical protein